MGREGESYRDWREGGLMGKEGGLMGKEGCLKALPIYPLLLVPTLTL